MPICRASNHLQCEMGWGRWCVCWEGALHGDERANFNGGVEGQGAARHNEKSLRKGPRRGGERGRSSQRRTRKFRGGQHRITRKHPGINERLAGQWARGRASPLNPTETRPVLTLQDFGPCLEAFSEGAPKRNPKERFSRICVPTETGCAAQDCLCSP